MNERRRILDDGSGGNVVTLRVTTTDGSTNVGIEMVVTNGDTIYPVTTDSQGKVELTGLSGGCTIDCETHEISVTEFYATGNMTIDISAWVNTFPVGEVRNYNYTGSVQQVDLIPGTYKLQVWGAQGGSNAADSSYSITAKAGGKGGYSEGIITLSTKTTVRIYVGGAGSSSAGGFNGGGSTSGSSTYNSGNEQGVSRMGGGGGATDIRLSDGALLSRMIVAGGGAGGAMCYKKVTTSSTITDISTGAISGNPSWYNSSSSTYITFYIWDTQLVVGRTYTLTIPSGISHFCTKFCKTTGGESIPRAQSVQTDYTDGRTSVTFTVPSGYPYFNVFTYNSSGYTSGTMKVTHTESSTTTSNDSQVGGVGGGTQGGAYYSTYAGKQNAAGSGGAFGQGANMTTTNYRYCSGAGGGGWYGGGTTYSDSGTTSCKYGGGGSGFVNTAASAGNRPSGYTGLQLDSGETKAGNTSFPNTAGTGNETGHAGNGYAKITRFAAYAVTLRFKDEEDSPVTGASVTVSNSENTYSLTTDSNGEATTTMINGTYNLSCSGYSLTPSQITVSSNATIDIVAAAPSIMDFSYTGAVQNTTLRAGTYKIECWGAQGGYRSSTAYGGKGGYSVGELTLSQNTNIYVYVGGSGNTGGTSGGFNGGGMRATYAGGGGGSDVRIGTDSLYARVIVAGGGGSDGATSKQGMYGGGTTGGTTTESYGTGGGGGTQTSGGTGSSSASGSGTSGTYGAFGVGGCGYAARSGYAGAGGGGWYGGAGSYPDGSGDDDRGGGGGSGYVYNSSTASSYPSGCLLDSSHYLANSQTIEGNASMPSTSGGTETGHSGNGFIRITKI